MRHALASLVLITTCISANAEGPAWEPTVSDIPQLMANACAAGAVEAILNVTPDKLSGDLEKDTIFVANATKKCVTANLMNKFLGDIEKKKTGALTPADKQEAGLAALSWYAQAVGYQLKNRVAQRKEKLEKQTPNPAVNTDAAR